MSRMLDDYEEQRSVAIRIAVEAGVLKVCEYHPDFLYAGSAEKESAYKLGNYKFTKDELKAVFSDRREMTDAIKAAIDEWDFSEKCARCEHLWNDDKFDEDSKAQL
jgi:hypothetical protein